MPSDIIAIIDCEVETLFSAANFTEEMQSDRFSSLEFTHSEAGIMLDLGCKLNPYKRQINESLSSYMHSAYKKALLSDPTIAKKLLEMQIEKLQQLVEGKYDDNYIRSRYAIGVTHRKLGLPFHQLIADYGKYKALLRPIIWQLCNGDIFALIAYLEALSTIIYYDLGVTLEAYCQDGKLTLIQIQHEYSQRTEQLLNQRNYDSLTGLPNRQSFKNQFDHLLHVAENQSLSIALINLGLDHFNTLNDTEGYATGDLALKEIGKRLQSYLGKDDLISYWGADKFVIALSNVEQTKNIERVCNELTTVVNAPLQSDVKKIQMTCSMGIAMYPEDCQTFDALIKSADSSMTLARKMGANKFQFFNKELDARLRERLSIAGEIRDAIAAEQFCLYYQPVADLQSGEIVCIEALVRWNHPVRGLLQPSHFIGIAEEFSVIHQLGAWILRRACTDVRQWRKEGISMPRLAINVSPKQLLEPGFTAGLLSTLTEFDILPPEITLEITESTLIHHSESMATLLQELKTYRFNLTMDDFGTGNSALQHLKHYPFDHVKIDQSFVTNILENSDDAAIANAVIAMAHNMGIKVIAEGVESELQCKYLSRAMCDQVQGFFLSKPIPPQQAGEFIATKFKLHDDLRRLTKVNRTILLVDDEANILAALKRVFRQDGYHILTAGSGAEGLEVLKQNQVDVIVSDQRMPNMTGVEFLRQAKVKYPDTVRIVLSGYTELQSITDAINEGAIYKFFTKPWEDQQIRDQISDAFLQKELFDENRRLGIKIQTANQELAMANRQLAELLQQKEKQLYRDETSLDIAREALLHVPIPMLGIGDDGMIAFANSAFEDLLCKDTALLGEHIDEILPLFSDTASAVSEGENFALNLPNFHFEANWRTMGAHSKSRGKIITFYGGK